MRLAIYKFVPQKACDRNRGVANSIENIKGNVVFIIFGPIMEVRTSQPSSLFSLLKV